MMARPLAVSAERQRTELFQDLIPFSILDLFYVTKFCQQNSDADDKALNVSLFEGPLLTVIVAWCITLWSRHTLTFSQLPQLFPRWCHPKVNAISFQHN